MLFLCGSWKVSRIGFVLDGVYCPLDRRTVVLITQDDCKILKIKPFLAMNCPAASRGVSFNGFFRFYRSKLRGIRPKKRLRVTIFVDIRNRKIGNLTTFCNLNKNLEPHGWLNSCGHITNGIRPQNIISKN